MDWTRGHTIGYGSSAAVSVATSHHSGELFAVKSSELSQSKFLQREQKILSHLSSPHVISYRGCEITRENHTLMYNIFMEYASYGSLAEAIRGRGGRLDEPLIVFYSRQIVQGLDYLHSRGLVHCDIKPSNILIGRGGAAKIADFGCAKWVDRDVVAAEIGGTPAFMAPEVVRGEQQGCPADIWALGCTVIEMASGGSPWPNVTDPVSVLYRVGYSGELPEIPNFLSNQAKDFLEKCLRRDSEERWTASQLLKHPFLGELNSNGKQIQESYISSPTSILDQGIWNSVEESEGLENPIWATDSDDSPNERIGRLSVISGGPNWDWEESWVAIRGNSGDESNIITNDIEAKSDKICGSLRYLITSDLLDSNSNSNSGSSWEVSKCRKDRAVISNLCFSRDKHHLLFPSSSSLLL